MTSIVYRLSFWQITDKFFIIYYQLAIINIFLTFKYFIYTKNSQAGLRTICSHVLSAPCKPTHRWL